MEENNPQERKQIVVALQLPLYNTLRELSGHHPGKEKIQADTINLFELGPWSWEYGKANKNLQCRLPEGTAMQRKTGPWMTLADLVLLPPANS